MPHPVIAIVGRPNVGKSRLFNRLIGKFTALVDDTSGVTRDRHYGFCEWAGQTFVFVDTGGLIPGSEALLNQKVWGQAFQAIQEADAIVCVLDGQTGLTPVDQALIEALRKTEKPKFFAVNKIDAAAHEKNLADFSRLGLEPLFPVSAEHGYKIADLLEALHKTLQGKEAKSQTAEEGLRLAIIGRPNVGKSTLLNQLAGKERVIVHETAGTTRDAIDISIRRGEKEFVFVDTAGIKRKRSTKTRLDKFSVVGSLKAVDRSQITLLLFDASEGLTHQERGLAHTIWEEGKGLCLLANKWDKVRFPAGEFVSSLQKRMGELQQVPILCLSAKTGQGCEKIWPVILRMERQWHLRIETAALNRWLEEVLDDQAPPARRGRNVRIYYGTQAGTAPPHLVLFTNEPRGLTTAYQRYLKNRFASRFDLAGIPVRLSIRKRR